MDSAWIKYGLLTAASIALCYEIPFFLIYMGVRLGPFAYPFIFSFLGVCWVTGYTIKYRGSKLQVQEKAEPSQEADQATDHERTLNDYLNNIRHKQGV